MAVSVQGLKSLQAKLKRLAPETRSALKQALAESADEMTRMMKNLAPEDSGDLKRSIGSTFGRYRAENSNVRGVSTSAGVGDPDLSVTIHAGDAKAWYAALVEFGTAPHTNGGRFKGSHNPGMAAQPYFFPAYRALKKRVKSRISRATTRAAKKAVSGGVR